MGPQPLGFTLHFSRAAIARSETAKKCEMMNHVKALCLLALVQFAALGAGHRATSADVITLVFTSLYSDHDDAQLAKQLANLQLAEQLNLHVVLYFQQAGTGPRALAALQALQHKSQNLSPPAAPVLTIQPLPSPDEQNQMLQRVVDYARGYVHSLPDFLCDQVTQRFTNLRRTGSDGNPQYGKSLRHSDSFTRVLRFAGGAEESQITKVNNKPANSLVTKSGLSISSGEFGGDMVIIFGPRRMPDLLGIIGNFSKESVRPSLVTLWNPARASSRYTTAVFKNRV